MFSIKIGRFTMKKRSISIRAFVFMLCLILFGFGFFWNMPCEAQWIKAYGGSENDYHSSAQQTSDGGYIVAGGTYSFGAGSQDLWLLKLDESGKAAWQKTYGGTGDEYTSFIQQTADGGYIVAGGTRTFGAGLDDAWVMKLDASGDITWQKTYGTTESDYVTFVQQTADGGYIVAGSTNSSGAGNYDTWLLKLDGSGNVSWQITYGGTLADWANSIQQTADGGYIVAGGTRSFGVGNQDFWLLKLDVSGNVTWEKAYGGTENDDTSFVRQTADGGYIVTGWTYSFGAGNRDIWVLKLDSAGNIAWQKAYGGAASDYAYSVQQTSEGGYVVAGGTYSFGKGQNDAWLLKLDASGNVAWEKTYGGPGGDTAYAVQPTSDGGYFMAGNNTSFGAGFTDLWVLKLDENGSTGTCPSEGISTADVTVTTVTATVSTAGTGTTSVTGVDTTVVPANSSATTSTICIFSDTQLRLKAGITKKRQGEGTVTSIDGFIDCPGSCEAQYPQGLDVTLSATPSLLSTFLGWKPSSPGCEGTDPCQITMDKKKTVKAIFQGPNKLKVVTTFKNDATGTVTSGDTLINCPGDCEKPYILNAPVTLTANEGIGSTFVKWTGKPCKDESTNVCTFEMNKNATVKAIFDLNP
jgi:hypothetical protein